MQSDDPPERVFAYLANGQSPAGVTGPRDCQPLAAPKRNRQHKALEDYYGREFAFAHVNGNTTPNFMLPRNPYRTQIIFQAEFDAANGSSYAHPLILSYPIHGPIVGEEWWGANDGGLAVWLAHSQADMVAGKIAFALPACCGSVVGPFQDFQLWINGYLYRG